MVHNYGPLVAMEIMTRTKEVTSYLEQESLCYEEEVELDGFVTLRKYLF